MAFSQQLVERAQRTERQCETTKEIFTSLLEPFRLIDLYPEIEEEVKPGVWKKRKEIQQHQKKLHDGIAPSGRNAKAVLFSGGFGSGKTRALCAQMFALMRKYPGIRIVCVDGDTIVGDSPIGDLVTPDSVNTVMGSSSASTPFRRGQAALWRVQTRSGRTISVTDGHRFLTQRGWIPLNQLGTGDVIACDGNWHGRSGSETPIDFQADYHGGLRCDDALLSPEVVVCLHTFRQILLLSSLDISRRLSSCDSSLRDKRPLSALEVELLPYEESAEYWPQIGHTLGQSQDFLPPLDSEQQSLLQEVLSGLASLPNYLAQVFCEVCEILIPASYCAYGLPHTDSCTQGSQQGSDLFRLRLCEDLLRDLPLCREREELLKHGLAIRQVSRPLLSENLLLDRLSELLRMLAWYPPYTHSIAYWDEITSIQYNKFGDFFDLSVFSGANYSGNGIFSHNCTTAYDYYFDEFLLPTWNEVVPEDSPHIKSYQVKSRTLKLTNGSQIRFHAYDDPNRIRGWEAHVIWIEEAAEIGDGNNEKAIAIFNALLGRLRASKPRYPLRIYVSQNPRGHNWVWKLFIRPEPTAPQPLGDTGKATQLVDRFGNPIWKRDKRGNPMIGEPVVYREWEKETVSGDIFYTISSGTHSNQYVPRGYVDTMLGNYADTPGLKERLVDGMFTPVNTLVYELPWFSTHTHCINYQDFLDYWEVSEIPFYWPVIVGIDCAGARSPWAVEYYVLAGGVEGGHWVGFDEIYEKGLTWGEIADKILAKGKRYENIRYFIDPISSNQRSGPLSETIKEEFQRRGIPTTPPKRYNKHGGIAKVHSFLRRDHSIPCPYKVEDVQIEDEAGNLTWEIGHSQLYYMKNIPGRRMVIDGRVYNEEGYGMPANIAEKGVYRWDDRKQSEGSEAEEGLTPVQSEKVMDRDDHAQTAEMFCFMSQYPNDTRERAKRTRNFDEDAGLPKVLYGQSRRRRVF